MTTEQLIINLSVIDEKLMLYEQNKDMCYKRYNGDQLHYHLGMGNETLTEARRYMSELISELNKCK